MSSSVVASGRRQVLERCARIRSRSSCSSAMPELDAAERDSLTCSRGARRPHWRSHRRFIPTPSHYVRMWVPEHLRRTGGPIAFTWIGLTAGTYPIHRRRSSRRGRGQDGARCRATRFPLCKPPVRPGSSTRTNREISHRFFRETVARTSRVVTRPRAHDTRTPVTDGAPPKYRRDEHENSRRSVVTIAHCA
jgi:hypothetical protein